MTKVKVIKRDGSLILNVQGHAQYNPGNDIVCAGASTLTYTLLQCMIAERDGENLDEFHSYINEEEGHFRLRVQPKEHAKAYVEVMFDTIATGFLVMANKYKNHVKLRYIDKTQDDEDDADESA